MESHGQRWYEEDHLFYLPDAKIKQLVNTNFSACIRRLEPSDFELFATFKSGITPEDWEEVEPELDNEAVIGWFEGGQLLSVADYYRWSQKAVADIGVLTAPECRGRGLARQVVQALCKHALEQGLLPQYRCQLNNTGSIAVAESAGFERFGRWTVAVDNK